MRMCFEQHLCISSTFFIKGKVFHGQVLPSGEATTTECGSQLSTTVNNVTEIAKYGALSCSRPQPAMDTGISDVRLN